MSTPIQKFFALLEDDAVVDLLPVVGGAIAVAQKTPGVLGLAAAKAYILGNGPAALLKAESDFFGQAAASLSTDFATLQAKAAADIAKQTSGNGQTP